MSSSTVNVAGISSNTSEKEVRDFFSFCGKIKNITIKDDSGTKIAEVTFEKNSAAKTALLLDSTQLGDAQVHVTSAAGVDPMAGKHDHDEEHEIAQEDKPRSRIMAEYLAHGYRLGDTVIQRGLAFDSQHGISNKFTQTLQNFDKRIDATGKAKSVDEKYQVSNKAYGAFGGLQSYFESALDSPTGQKLRAFYEQGSKQVQDVHSEAVRLSGLNNKPATVSGTSRTTCKCGSDTKNCPCAPGTCACSSCSKNPDEKSTTPDNKPHQIKGTDRTACNCQADPKNCPCESGTCACAGCSKNPEASSSSSGGKFEPHDIKGTKRTACSCQAAESKCGCPPGNCACSSCKKNPDAESSSSNQPQKVAGADRTTCNCGSDTKNCPCAPGTCACASCAKNPDEKSSHPANGYTPQKIGGSDRTACKCQAKDEVCGCAPGTCACAKCSKNPDSKQQESGNKPEKVGNTDRTTCNCGADTKNCPCAPGTCACGSCAKNPDVKSGASAEEMDMHKVGGDRTECKCGSTAEKCPCAPGTCACGSCAKNPDAQKA